LSFEVPAIITAPDTTITSLLSADINPGGLAALFGCATIDSVVVYPSATTSNPPSTLTKFNCIGGSAYIEDDFSVPITSPGVYENTFENATLTISPTISPEPSSLFLLGTGLIGGLGLVRRKLA
jgi:hypothetical protein